MNPTPLTKPQLDQLMSHLHPSRVVTRGQGNQKLSYLAAYDVKATLVRIFGFGGFSAEVIREELVEVNKEATNSQGKPAVEVTALATVRLTIHQLGAVYTESAISSQKGQQIGEVADFALKTAASDALKRCAIYLGTQFGLSLYDNGSTMEIVRVVLAEDQMRLLGQGQAPPQQQVTDEQSQMLRDQLGAEDIDQTATQGEDPA